ncbi:MAG: condensation domain-containing protein, partial [Actinobacteria bacterium]|nr:condensation domain-containing protein [Actinomycetota bacterium]
ALRRSREESWRPFDLARGPLVRARLYRLGPEDHLAALTMHHAVSDGWSIGVLVYEAGVLYEAFAKGEPSPLPELPIQYADYAVWQRGWLKGEVLDAQLGYWRGVLAGVPTLELPTDRPRPGVASGDGAQRFRDLPKPLADGLRALGRKEGTTLFMTLFAGLETLLYRYSGQVDFAIGSPIAGRTMARTENLIGYFANTLALRADLSGEPTFRELLRRVRKASLGAYAHQDLPFEQVVVDLHPDRDAGRSPVFQVMFVLQNAPLPALETPGLTLAPVDVESVTAKFDLTLSVIEIDQTLKASLEYATDLFDAATAGRMLAHLETLLGAAVAEPDKPVSSLPMMTEEEQRSLLGWNAPGKGDRSGPGLDPEEALADLENLSEDELDALINGI